jgi:hypothetical protein
MWVILLLLSAALMVWAIREVRQLRESWSPTEVPERHPLRQWRARQPNSVYGRARKKWEIGRERPLSL